MWNYSLNEGCSWQEILLSWARDVGVVKHTFQHPSCYSPPTDSQYLASETQNSAFGNQLVLGRWWESAVWWETWCLWCELCCSWGEFLFSYVLISAKSGRKHHFSSVIPIHGKKKKNLHNWRAGGKNKKVQQTQCACTELLWLGQPNKIKCPEWLCGHRDPWVNGQFLFIWYSCQLRQCVLSCEGCAFGSQCVCAPCVCPAV